MGTRFAATSSAATAATSSAVFSAAAVAASKVDAGTRTTSHCKQEEWVRETKIEERGAEWSTGCGACTLLLLLSMSRMGGLPAEEPRGQTSSGLSSHPTMSMVTSGGDARMSGRTATRTSSKTWTSRKSMEPGPYVGNAMAESVAGPSPSAKRLRLVNLRRNPGGAAGTWG